jgi:L-fuconolactonase
MTTKRLEGRDEDILEPDMPIIDAHHHLFDRPAMRYMLDDYVADAHAGHNIVASIYLETNAFSRIDGPEVLRPLGEIEFAAGMAAMSASGQYGPCRINAAIIGYADMRLGDDVALLLDRALEMSPGRFRGVRQITLEHSSESPFRFITHRPPTGVLQSDGFRDAFRHLGQRGLTFDAAVFHQQLGDIAALAAAFSDTVIVLNHLGTPMGMDADAEGRAEIFRDWRVKLAHLAQYPNVMCKVGGLGMPFLGFGFERREDVIGYRELAETWRPYVETAIEKFGPGRCMMESNFPPDGRSSGFVPLWNAMKHITRAYSAEERAALFYGNAAHIYHVAGLPDEKAGAGRE